MARRFSDEPINLIHRIPTPEQLASARPLNRSWNQVIAETVATYVRTTADMIAQVTGICRMTQAKVEAGRGPTDHPDEFSAAPATDSSAPFDAGANESTVIDQPIEAAARPGSQEDMNPSQSVPTPTAVQPEEVAELRAYLLSQQQDIARLSVQIQELKSLVVSQQQVLLCLGKELESRPVSPLMQGVASAAPKRNRPVRQKPMVKDKAAAAAEKEDLNRSSLSFWPGPARRPEL
jgi:hypothetical protein